MRFDVIVSGGAAGGRLEASLASLANAGGEAPPNVFLLSPALPGGGGGEPVPPGPPALHIQRIKTGDAPAKALNTAAAMGGADILLLLAAGQCLPPGFFDALEGEFAAFPEAAALQCATLPADTPRHIDPVTLEMPVADAAPLAIRREAWQALGGLDPRLGPEAFADLSWRLLAQNRTLRYLPDLIVTSPLAGEAPDTLDSYAEGLAARFLLACKYGEKPEIKAAREEYKTALRYPRHFDGVRRRLLADYLLCLAKSVPLRGWRRGNPEAYAAGHRAFAANLTVSRGTYPLIKGFDPARGPRISVVIRTHARPELLRQALESLENQRYRNFEVVVVEDGPPTAQGLTEGEFAHLPLRYHATGQPVGRSRAGNLGMELAGGDYLNLLDDDDLFYPDHLEQMAAAAAAHPEAELILGRAMAMEVHNTAFPGARTPLKLTPVAYDRLDIFTLSQKNQISIQSAMFKKTLFQREGGLDEGLDSHEDWAMWLRFFRSAQRAHPHTPDIPRATSLYMLPAGDSAHSRAEGYEAGKRAVLEDETLRYTLSLAELRGFYDGLIGDIAHLHARGGGELEAFLQQELARPKPPAEPEG